MGAEVQLPLANINRSPTAEVIDAGCILKLTQNFLKLYTWFYSSFLQILFKFHS